MSGLLKRQELLCIFFWVYLLLVGVTLWTALAVEFEGFEGKEADHWNKDIDIFDHPNARKIVQTLPFFKHCLLHFNPIAESFY